MRKPKRTDFPKSLRKAAWEMAEDNGRWEDFPIERLGETTIAAVRRALADSRR